MAFLRGRRAWSVGLSLALLTLLAVGCKGEKTGPGGEPPATHGAATNGAGATTGGALLQEGAKAEEADTLALVIAGSPETMDPGKMSGAPEGMLAFNCFEGLWMPSQDSGAPVYGAAKSHEVSADGRVWTIQLREDAKWSNGDPVLASDFVFAWKRVLTPGFDADYAEMLDIFKGAAAYRKGETKDWETVGVKAEGERTLKVELVNPTPYLTELFAFYTFFPVHQKTVEAHGEDWVKPEHYIGNGAYKLAKYEHQQHLLLERSEAYWDKANVSIPKVRIRIIKDNTAQLNAFKSGQLDIMSGGIPVGQIPALRGYKEFRMDPLLGTYFYRVNVKANEALGKAEVRQALALAVDRKALVQRTLKGLPLPAGGFVPEMPGYTPKTKLDFDPDKARDLLAKAGYPEGKGFPETTLLFNTDENHKLLAEIIQDMWKRELGITIKLENMEWKTYLEAVDKGNFEIARAGWIGDYSDPETFLIIMTSGNGNNDTGWGDPAYDQLVLGAQAEADPKKRFAMQADAEEKLMAAMPVIPIYFYRNAALVSTRVEGFGANNRDVHLVKYMRLR